jgi:hypothetical protein
MLNDRIREHVEPLLRPGETIEQAMAGFRPLSRSLALVVIFPLVVAGFAVSAAAGVPAWVGAGVGGGLGAGLSMWLDQRRARAEHGGKGLSIGLVVTTQRLFVLDLKTGPVLASVAGVDLEAELSDLEHVETQRMQGSGLKRPGVVIRLRDRTVLQVIPARAQQFVAALAR